MRFSCKLDFFFLFDVVEHDRFGRTLYSGSLAVLTTRKGNNHL